MYLAYFSKGVFRSAPRGTTGKQQFTHDIKPRGLLVAHCTRRRMQAGLADLCGCDGPTPAIPAEDHERRQLPASW